MMEDFVKGEVDGQLHRDLARRSACAHVHRRLDWNLCVASDTTGRRQAGVARRDNSIVSSRQVLDSDTRRPSYRHTTKDKVDCTTCSGASVILADSQCNPSTFGTNGVYLPESIGSVVVRSNRKSCDRSEISLWREERLLRVQAVSTGVPCLYPQTKPEIAHQIGRAHPWRKLEIS